MTAHTHQTAPTARPVWTLIASSFGLGMAQLAEPSAARAARRFLVHGLPASGRLCRRGLASMYGIGRSDRGHARGRYGHNSVEISPRMC